MAALAHVVALPVALPVALQRSRAVTADVYSHTIGSPTTARSTGRRCSARGRYETIGETRLALALDDVVSLEDFWFASELDSDVCQEWHQLLTVGLQLLARVPDFADTQVPSGPKQTW